MSSWLQNRRSRIAAALVVLLLLLAGGWSYSRITKNARPRPVILAETIGAKFPFYYRWVDARIGSPKYKFPKALVTRVTQASFRHSDRRIKAAEELAGMGTNAWPVVPVLIDYLDRKDFEGFAAATVLARISAQDHPDWTKFERRLSGKGRASLLFRHMLFGRDSYSRTYDAAHRRFAIIALGAVGPAAAPAYAELIEIVKYGQDQELRGLALEAAARIDVAKTLPLVKDFLRNEAEWPQVSAAAALTLADVASNDPQARDLLRSALQDPRSLSRLGAARALWRLKAPADQVLPAMTSLLNHKLASIREAALEAIAEMGVAAGQCRPEVERLMTDENEAVRRSAAATLRSIGEQESPVS